MSNGQRWGENASFPGWEKLKTTTWKAAKDPLTWVPLAGAAVLSFGDLDEDLSDWAIRESPLFDSESSANDASDNLRDGLAVVAAVTAVATPSGPESGEWMKSKFKGMLVEGSAVALTNGVKNGLKNSTNRERPSGTNDRSFPSGHASSAFSYATLTGRNVDAMNLSPLTKRVLRYSANTAAGVAGWAVIESRKHYPTDVLFGAALGHFLTAVVHDSFMGEDESVLLGVQLDGDGGGMLTVHMPF